MWGMYFIIGTALFLLALPPRERMRTAKQHSLEEIQPSPQEAGKGTVVDVPSPRPRLDEFRLRERGRIAARHRAAA
jgi:hypothetical protein